MQKLLAIDVSAGARYTAIQGREGAREAAKVDVRVLDKVADLMRDERVDYKTAFKKVLLSDANLAREYRAAHQRPVLE